LENYQTEDGFIVPEVLRPYMGGKEFIPFKTVFFFFKIRQWRKWQINLEIPKYEFCQINSLFSLFFSLLNLMGKRGKISQRKQHSLADKLAHGNRGISKKVKKPSSTTFKLENLATKLEEAVQQNEAEVGKIQKTNRISKLDEIKRCRKVVSELKENGFEKIRMHLKNEYKVESSS
jgi:hypothetical protein